MRDGASGAPRRILRKTPTTSKAPETIPKDPEKDPEKDPKNDLEEGPKEDQAVVGGEGG